MKLPFLFLCLPICLCAQSSVKRDSLLQVAQSASDDTTRVWALMETGKLYLQTQPDTAVRYIGAALALAESAGFEKGVAKCRINRSFAYNNLGRYRESVTDCQAAAPICEKLGLKKELVATYNNMGNAWDYLGNRWQAIDAFSKALRALDGVELPPHFPIVVRNNIARQYNNVRLYDKGLTYAQKSYEEAMALGDSAQVAAALHILSFSNRMLGREADALAQLVRVERLARSADDPTLLVYALNNIASIERDKKPVESMRKALESLAVARKTGDLFGEVSALEILARFCLYEKKYAEAEKYAREGLQKAQSQHMNDEVANCALILSDLALVKNDIPAFRNLRSLFFAMTDTLANQSLVHATQELETRYETEKKEQQILQLERERELQRLRLQQKNVLMWGFAGLSGLFLIIGFLSVRNLRHRRRLAEQALKIRDQEIAQIKQEQQIYVADALLKGQEEERSRLAKDLHDGLGGILSGVRQVLNGAKNAAGTATAFETAMEGLDVAIRELRNMARNMMPEALTRFGLKDALRDYCDHLSLGSSAKIHFQAVGFDKRLPQKDEVFVFRIAQELLNNTIKHAEASQVIVQLDQVGDRSALTIEDDGKGFDRTQLARAPGVGWQNIQSRVEYLGGSLDLRTSPGKGTSVRVEI